MYSPSEDSFLMSETLRNNLKNKDKTIKILDMGTGSGIQALTLKNLGFKNILAADIDKESIKFARTRGIRVINSDLFSNIKSKFGIIIFNPPYLPENKHDRKQDTSGGRVGDETIIKFLKQARFHLNENSQIILLVSSLTPHNRVNSIIKKYFKKQILAEKRIFFEKLEIWLLTKNKITS
ncbi:MAG: methyltransferase [Nanoarchaeota archaeon]|nr:methyltransferase [Nanoarchaeota archaeon]MBU4087024.1 methyltransferase [Nanoarchaeota archaeon]